VKLVIPYVFMVWCWKYRDSVTFMELETVGKSHDVDYSLRIQCSQSTVSQKTNERFSYLYCPLSLREFHV